MSSLSVALVVCRRLVPSLEVFAVFCSYTHFLSSKRVRVPGLAFRPVIEEAADVQRR